MQQMHLLLKDASPVGDPQVRHVRKVRPVLLQVRRAQPSRLDILGEAALKHRIPRDLTEVHRGEVPNLLRDAIPLDSRGRSLANSPAALPSKAPGHPNGPKTACFSMFFFLSLLGLMEHQRVVGGQRDVETALEVHREGALLIGQEELVVTAGRHRQADLRQVEEVLPRVTPMEDLYGKITYH